MEIKMMRHAFYGAIDPRRRKEQSDFDMVQEDHTKVANLPENGYQTPFRSRMIRCSLDHDSEVR